MNPNQDEITLCSGTEIGDKLDSCISTIEEGEAVNLETAKTELPQAMVIAAKQTGGEVVAVGAVKRQRPWYASDIAKKSGFPFDKNLHELGYVSVRELHQNQGLSGKIVSKLLDSFKSRPLFATTSNEYMKKTLSKAGFEKQGKEWQGENSVLTLWIKVSA